MAFAQKISPKFPQNIFHQKLFHQQNFHIFYRTGIDLLAFMSFLLPRMFFWLGAPLTTSSAPVEGCRTRQLIVRREIWLLSRMIY